MQDKFKIVNDNTFGYEQVRIEKYEPNKIAGSLNDVTFFVASDEIDMADLQRYVQETQTDCLIAIHTTDKHYDCLSLANNIIHCTESEIEQVIYGLAFMPFGHGYVAIEWQDIKNAFSMGQSIQFIESHATGDNRIKEACDNLLTKFHRINADYSLECALSNAFLDIDNDFDMLEYITQTVDKILPIDEANIFYQVNFFEEFEFWNEGEQGCCICMYLIYADKETNIKSDFIEHNTTEKITQPTQRTGNSIQEYLKCQQQKK